ncbi:salicylate hydroxylase [Streptomyces violarus]|uniref:Salicylate hydroxylase n=1 Tax=Streptomyces violarus TaxID=67380 RepID=A0A7W4ZSY4_9ACTN|nr:MULTISPECIES: FAD-dependent monooxygenase [Streptomyces]MBB3078100.1 salicylate hydroxylase [Streptomyces violarus]WRT99745.1 FAD-dependent monooxygenase [Streptomyces sp. CGMCC 4.1772]GHD19686.1 salicylate hydroxylase [Streptomyces violarus]
MNSSPRNARAGSAAGAVRVAVVGAGIAGLTLALALDRAGVRCEVFEQAEALREVGAGVQIAPNASRLLRRLVPAAQLDEVAVRPAAVEMRRWDDDRLLDRAELGTATEVRYGAPYYLMHRADLHEVLRSGFDPGRLHLASRCVRVEELPDRVLLHFQDGSVRDADLVVGADGIRSVVREALAADRPRFSGQSMYRGLVPARELPFLMDEPKVRLWFGPEQHCVCYPVSAGRWMSVGATAPAGDWNTESWTARGRTEELLHTYRGWSEQVRAVLGALSTVSRWALHDRDPLERWTSDRIAVAGDSAHPMLPFMAQGANQAIEDAVVLATCLAGTGPEDVPAALARYERVRKPRTDRIQRMSRANSRTFHLEDGDGQRERDTALGRQQARDQEWLFGHDAEEPAEVPL